MKHEDDDQSLLRSVELLCRLADVSAMLHLEQGDKEQLLKERAQLVDDARRLGLFQRGPSLDTDQ